MGPAHRTDPAIRERNHDLASRPQNRAFEPHILFRSREQGIQLLGQQKQLVAESDEHVVLGEAGPSRWRRGGDRLDHKSCTALDRLLLPEHGRRAGEGETEIYR